MGGWRTRAQHCRGQSFIRIDEFLGSGEAQPYREAAFPYEHVDCGSDERVIESRSVIDRTAHNVEPLEGSSRRLVAVEREDDAYSVGPQFVRQLINSSPQAMPRSADRRAVLVDAASVASAVNAKGAGWLLQVGLVDGKDLAACNAVAAFPTRSQMFPGAPLRAADSCLVQDLPFADLPVYQWTAPDHAASCKERACEAWVNNPLSIGDTSRHPPEAESGVRTDST